MSPGYTVPIHTRFLRWCLRPLFRGLFRLLSPVIITGLEHLPQRSGYLVAMNHISYFDSPFVTVFWPTAPEVVGAIEIWSRPGQSILVRLYGAIPVHRGEVDRQLLQAMIAVLESGRNLVIAPEGGRSHTPGLRRAHPGVAYIADKTGASVVPVGVVGTTSDYFARATRLERPPLEMHIGEPFRLPPVETKGIRRRMQLQANADLVMRQIAALLPPEYRGVYAGEGPLEAL
jgi:1-acyl-sn-glycerol-3-phosphate acyltransferase